MDDKGVNPGPVAVIFVSREEGIKHMRHIVGV